MKIATIFCWVITAFLYLMWSVFRENPPKIFFDGAPIMLYVSIFVTIGYIIRMKIKKKPKKDISETKIEKVSQPTDKDNTETEKVSEKRSVIYHNEKNEYERTIIQFKSNDDGSAEIIDEMRWAATKGGSNGGQSVTVVPKEYFEENTVEDFRKMLSNEFSEHSENYDFSSVEDNPIIGEHFAVHGKKDDKLSERLLAKEASQFVKIYGFSNRTKEQKESLSYRTLVFDEKTDKLYIRRGEVSGLTGHGFAGNPDFVYSYTEVSLEELCETVSGEDKQEMLKAICKSNNAHRILPFTFNKNDKEEQRKLKENWEETVYETIPCFDTSIQKTSNKKSAVPINLKASCAFACRILPAEHHANICIDLLSGQPYYSCYWIAGMGQSPSLCCDYITDYYQYKITWDEFVECIKKNSDEAYEAFKNINKSNWRSYIGSDWVELTIYGTKISSEKYNKICPRNRLEICKYFHKALRSLPALHKGYELYSYHGRDMFLEYVEVYKKDDKWVLHDYQKLREKQTVETVLKDVNDDNIYNWIIDYIIDKHGNKTI